jgi:hypothetical protein
MATSWRQLLNLVLCYIQIPGQIKKGSALNKGLDSNSLLMYPGLNDGTVKM